MRIGKYVLYFIHKNKVFTVNLDFRVDLSKYASVLCKFNIKKIYLKKNHNYLFFKTRICIKAGAGTVVQVL